MKKTSKIHHHAANKIRQLFSRRDRNTQPRHAEQSDNKGDAQQGDLPSAWNKPAHEHSDSATQQIVSTIRNAHANRLRSEIREWLLVLFTGAIVVGTLYYASVAKRQADLMSQQRDVMIQQANASQRQAEVAVKQLYWGYRPWVALDGSPKIKGPLKFYPDGSPYADVEFTCRNQAGSPAFGFVINAHFITHQQELNEEGTKIPECDDWETLKDRAVHHSQIILSGASATEEREILRRGDSELHSNQPSEVYLVGCIAYGDFLLPQADNLPKEQKNAPRHATYFLAQFVSNKGEKIVSHEGPIQGRFVNISSSSYRAYEP